MSKPLKQLARTLLVGVAAAGPAIEAAQAAPVDAGSLLRQTQQAEDARQAQPSEPPKLMIQREERAEPVDSTPFRLNQLVLSGNRSIALDELLKLAEGLRGRDVTLAELGALSQRITALYRSQGYPLARAVVPAQTIRDGVVRIEIYEATLGRVKLTNRTALRDDAILSQTAALEPGKTISDADLERSLLLVSDIAGIQYQAVLTPGDAVGSSDLGLQVTPGKAYDATAGLDNAGNAATGRVRAIGAVAWFNPLGSGDAVNLNLMSSGKDMAYLRVAGEGLLPGAGARWGAAVSELNYTLGGALAGLQGHGNAGQVSAWARYALVRSVARSTQLQAQFDRLSLNDALDASGVHNNRSIDVLTGEVSDSLRGDGSVSWWTLVLSSGRLKFNNGAAQDADAASARTLGSFFKADLNANHLRSLGGQRSLLLSATAQTATKNLDSSQKLQLGGANLLRAYDTGAVSADAGYALSAEYRDLLAVTPYGGWQWTAFIETGAITASHEPWTNASPNSAHLSGAGLGLNLEGAGPWSAKAHVAKSLGGNPNLPGVSRSERAWVSVARAF